MKRDLTAYLSVRLDRRYKKAVKYSNDITHA